MSKKVYLEDEGMRKIIRKDDLLHAKHPVDVQLLKKHEIPHMPRNPNTHISIRLPQNLCDWIWEQYPNEPTISSAVQRYLKDRYDLRTQVSPVQ